MTKFPNLLKYIKASFHFKKLRGENLPREQIGYVISGSSHDRFYFVIQEGKQVEFGNYYIIQHPTKKVDVLTRAVGISWQNPEMAITRHGPRYAKKGITLPAEDQEICIAEAEPLGYLDNGKFRPLELPAPTWSPIYETTEKDLQPFLTPTKEGYYIKIGRLRNTKIPIYLDVNNLVKGHCFLAGMTRAGKSTLINSLAVLGKKADPPIYMVILDRRGEYKPLEEKAEAQIIPYIKFLSRKDALSPEIVSSKLGFSLKTKAGETIVSAVNELLQSSESLNRKNLISKIEEVSETIIQRNREKILESINNSIQRKGDFIEELPEEAADIVEFLLKNPVTIIDFSIDTNIERHQLCVKAIINRLLQEAITNDKFGAIVAIEEAQYFVPEHGMIKFGDPGKSGVDQAIIEAISQGGGYNLGFIIMTQRPAYVSKSVISQCNTLIAFRVMSGADQKAIMEYTEYGTATLAAYLAGLADHEAFITGMAIPTRFPLIVETDVYCYPAKARKSAKETFAAMENR